MKNPILADSGPAISGMDASLPLAIVPHDETSRDTMQAAPESCCAPANRLLAALPEADYQRLAPHLQPAFLHAGQVLFSSNAPGHGILFPSDGMVSVVLSSADGSEVETIPIGREGMVGRVAFILGDTPTFRQAMVQASGCGWRLPLEAVKKECEQGGSLCALLRDYLENLLITAGLIAVCKRRHQLEARLSHWLLFLSERMQLDDLPFGQEMIADLIAARASEVTVASGLLWREKLIRFNHNSVTLLDRQRLQRKACECSAILQSEQAQLFSNAAMRHAV